MFQLFGAGHLATLGVLFVLCSCVVWVGRRLRDPGKAWLGRIIGLLLLGYAAAIYTRHGLAGELSWDWSLPLHLCHLVLIACFLSLLRPYPLAFELAYFWGMGGTVHALLTPEVEEGFPSWEFIQFFWSHGGILLAIVYLIGVQRMKPRPGSVLRMFLATNIYAAIAGMLNFAFGWNYGYLCRPPSQPSLIDYLGPWPWYLLSLEGVALLTFWLLDLPWRIARRRNPSPAS